MRQSESLGILFINRNCCGQPALLNRDSVLMNYTRVSSERSTNCVECVRRRNFRYL